jgi:hypothetical protein
MRSFKFTRFQIWLLLALTTAVFTSKMQGSRLPGNKNPELPFTFVENSGQVDARVRYIGFGPELKAWFEDNGMYLQNHGSAVRMTFAGTNTTSRPAIHAGESAGAHANYLHGSDPQAWQMNLPLVNSIRYESVWPGIDVVYRTDHGGMKAEYLVKPGAAVDWIRLQFDAAVDIETNGALRIKTQSGDFREDAPVLYQLIGGERRVVHGRFRQTADREIGFVADGYDPHEPLVIDPSVIFSGHFGGSSQDTITSVAIDHSNNIVVAGWTSSTDLPASNGARKVDGGGVDAFVASFLPNGGGLIYCTYLGGSSDDRAFGVAVDSSRNVYVTGQTSSTNFPVMAPLQPHLSGTRDAFVTKLNPAGNALIYSTYLGGSGVDVGNAISLDSANEAVIGGDTTSTNLPASTGTFQARLGGSQDAFVAKLSAAGNSLVFLTYFGGSGTDHCTALFVAAQGGIVFGGSTSSSNFPTAGLTVQPGPGGGQDGFIAKLSPAGSKLSFSTYVGGSGGSPGAPEQVNALTTDAQFNIIAAGTTSSTNFPVTPGAYQTTPSGQTDGFIMRLNGSGALLQSTYLGGALSDAINAVAVDFHGNPYVAGTTDSLDFPVQNPTQSSNGGGMDAFIVKLNPSLSSVIFGTYLGGSSSDGANAIAVDSETSVVVVGQTGSGDFPALGSLQHSTNEMLSSFITKITPSFTMGVGYAYQGQMTFTADPWHVASYTASTTYGTATDIPIAGDWTGSGVKRIGVFRNGTWILDTNGNGVLDAADKTVVFGQAGDVPVVGDWRGTGQIALGLFRHGTFILDLSGHLSGTPTGLQDATFVFGQGGDVPVAGDWTGSGTTKVGVFRNGLWLLDSNGDHVYNGSDRAYTYGQAGDVPVVGDWDSSGIPNKIGVYRAGVWVLDYDGDGVWTTPGLTEMTIGFGFTGYSPLVF